MTLKQEVGNMFADLGPMVGASNMEYRAFCIVDEIFGLLKEKTGFPDFSQLYAGIYRR
jgi:hypothetical protein